uniref:DUF805 domain-containing protein n=1 Tax=Thermorudis peleae TaxID=1382356 RepID=A0A831X7A6_9BACT
MVNSRDGQSTLYSLLLALALLAPLLFSWAGFLLTVLIPLYVLTRTDLDRRWYFLAMLPIITWVLLFLWEPLFGSPRPYEIPQTGHSAAGIRDQCNTHCGR